MGGRLLQCGGRLQLLRAIAASFRAMRGFSARVVASMIAQMHCLRRMGGSLHRAVVVEQGPALHEALRQPVSCFLGAHGATRVTLVEVLVVGEGHRYAAKQQLARTDVGVSSSLVVVAMVVAVPLSSRIPFSVAVPFAVTSSVVVLFCLWHARVSILHEHHSSFSVRTWIRVSPSLAYMLPHDTQCSSRVAGSLIKGTWADSTSV
jgi:hypothetical protein